MIYGGKNAWHTGRMINVCNELNLLGMEMKLQKCSKQTQKNTKTGTHRHSKNKINLLKWKILFNN